MRRSLSKTCTGILFSVAALSAFSLEELETISHLNPMPGPDVRHVGWQWHYVDQDGVGGYMEKVGGDQKLASYIRSDGCAWTRIAGGFAPAMVWQNCPSTGSAEVTFIDGNIWPIQTGNQFSYQIKGTSSLLSKVWKSKRKCKVAGQVKIKTVAGVFDTFKLNCKERWGLRSWWLAPSVGTAVAYQQETIRGGYVLQEMTHIKP